MVDKEWLRSNIEIERTGRKWAIVIVPVKRKLRIYKDAKGKYIKINKQKIHSRHL